MYYQISRIGNATMLCIELFTRKIRFYVYSGNWKAKAFYEKLGFTFLEEVDFFMETEILTDHIL